MKTFEIQTMQEVEQFLRYVIEPNGLALGMGFHPDDDFSDYMKENGEKVLPNDEVKALNEMTGKCFAICKRKKCQNEMHIHSHFRRREDCAGTVKNVYFCGRGI